MPRSSLPPAISRGGSALIPPVGGKVFTPLRTGSPSTHVGALNFFLNGADGIVLASASCTDALPLPSYSMWAINASRARLHIPYTRLSSSGRFRKVAA